MKLGPIFAAAAAAALLCCARNAPAPAAEVRPLDGAGFRHLVSTARGRPLVVNFWATWCQPCRDEIPALEELARSYGGKVQVVGVSVDDPARLAEVRRYLSERGVTFPQYIRAEADDEAFINAVDPSWSGAVPSTFIYDSTGTRAGRLVGQQTRDTLEAALAHLATATSRLRPEPSAASAR